ncbi:MAG TPA: NAD(P)-dependent oxidoreductase [Acidimicrobiales bacterium]|nr:NAD(P)-dependent oxidoreductase [Acidimicrobiales bacterium]
MTPAVLGFVGLGQMGSPMATRIAAAGFDLACFDAAGTAERLPAGATAAASVADVAARVDTMFLSLPDGDASLAVAGAVVAAAGRRVRTVIDLSTVGPAVAADAAELLAPVGVVYADGPVSGGVAGARAGTISLMFAGPRAVLDDHRAVLDSFANVFAVGSHAGQGQTMKLINNFLSATALASTSEALALGEAHGLDMTVMLNVLNASTGRNSATVDKFPNRVVPGRFDAGFRTGLMAKDLRLYAHAVAGAGTADTIGTVVSDVWQQADAALPGSDFTRIWEFVRSTPPFRAS